MQSIKFANTKYTLNMFDSISDMFIATSSYTDIVIIVDLVTNKVTEYQHNLNERIISASLLVQDFNYILVLGTPTRFVYIVPETGDQVRSIIVNLGYEQYKTFTDVTRTNYNVSTIVYRNTFKITKIIKVMFDNVHIAYDIENNNGISFCTAMYCKNAVFMDTDRNYALLYDTSAGNFMFTSSPTIGLQKILRNTRTIIAFDPIYEWCFWKHYDKHDDFAYNNAYMPGCMECMMSPSIDAAHNEPLNLEIDGEGDEFVKLLFVAGKFVIIVRNTEKDYMFVKYFDFNFSSDTKVAI